MLNVMLAVDYEQRDDEDDRRLQSLPLLSIASSMLLIDNYIHRACQFEL